MKHISREPISLDAYLKHDTPASGAIVLFSGEARNHHAGRGVEILEYEAHEDMAESYLEGILSDAKEKFSLELARCVHRVGRVEIGQSAVVVVTAAAHREEAYAANRYIIDRIKSEAPIWKKEFFQDGTSEWGK